MRRFILACAVAAVSLAAASLAVAAPPVVPAVDPAKDPAAKAAVVQVERFFAAMKAGDEAALKAILLPDVTLTSQRFREGQVTLRRVVAAEWAANLAKAGGPVVNERMWSPLVLRRGPMLVVWAPYEVLIDGKSSHCGIDVVDMVEVDGAWRIAHLMWTQEPTACAELKSGA